MEVAPISAGEALAWTCLVAALLLAGLIALGALAPEAARNITIGGALEVVIYVAASLWLVKGARPRSSALGLTRAPLGLLLAALLLGVFVHAPADFLAWIGQRLFPESESVLRERARALAPASLSGRVALASVVVFAAPLVEELFFRGALYARLLRTSEVRARAHAHRRAIGVTAVCFALSHVEPRIWLALAPLGVVLGILRAQNYGIFPSFLLHAAFNATTLAVAFAEPRRAPVVAPDPLLVLLGTAVSGALLVLVVRFSRGGKGAPA